MDQPTGLVAFWKDYDRALYLKAAILADELGYDSFWLPEAWGYEVFTLITEMALKTKRIKLGTGIINAFSRSPGLIAMSTATVDEISEGRFILGLGTSSARVIEGFHGREFNKPLTQVRDVIRIVRALLAGAQLTSADAKLVDYRPFTLAMEPARPTVPIYVAALKENSIRSIGELADGWIPTFWPYQELARGKQWIAEGAAKAGRDAGDIVCAPYTSAIPLDAQKAVDMAREIIAFYIGGMGDYYIELLSHFGYAEECKKIDDLYNNKSTRGEAKHAVTDEMMNALAITGEPTFCIDELRRRRQYGMDLPLLNLPNKAPWEVVEYFIRTMAPR